MRGVILLLCGWFAIAAIATEAAAQGGMMHKDGMGGMMQGGEAQLPELLPSQLPDPKSEGAELTVRYCAQCHNLPSPATHSAEEWREVLSRMDRYMSGHTRPHGMMIIHRPTSEEQEALLQYLQRNALRTFSGPSLPDPGSPGAARTKEVCGRCHALPDPSLHTAEEWPAVVERMRRNMKVMGKPVINDTERNEISDYLKRHARQGTE
ncbi:MAG TPA: cytochrome c [Nitrospiria bacterium]|nr:cytochrome c [Nitrospiria bacterium]